MQLSVACYEYELMSERVSLCSTWEVCVEPFKVAFMISKCGCDFINHCPLCSVCPYDQSSIQTMGLYKHSGDVMKIIFCD